MTLIQRILSFIGVVGQDVKALNNKINADAVRFADVNEADPTQVTTEQNENGENIPVIHFHGIFKAFLNSLPGTGNILSKDLVWIDIGTPTSKLATPTLSLSAKTDTTATIAATQVSGATSYVWYKDGTVISGATSSTLNLTGLTASTSYVITCKVTGAGYSDSNLATYNLTTNAASGGYAVDRRIRINLSNEYTSPSYINSPKWNDLMLKSSELGVANGFVSTFLATETSAATLIKITNPTTWAGASATILSPYPTTALYPATIGNTGLQFNSWDSPPQLKLTGLDAAKYYQLYIAVLSDGASDVMNIGIGADVKTKSSYNNVGVNTDVEMQSPVWTVFNNKQGTEITINFSKNAGGSAFFVTAIIVEETTTQKP